MAVIDKNGYHLPIMPGHLNRSGFQYDEFQLADRLYFTVNWIYPGTGPVLSHILRDRRHERGALSVMARGVRRAWLWSEKQRLQSPGQ